LHVLPVAMEFLKAYPAVDIRCVLNDSKTISTWHSE